MKKIIAVLIFVVSGLTIFSPAKASSPAIDDKDKVALMTAEQKQQRLEDINTRVQEIKNMDKTTLTKEDKTELKTELKQMNKEAKIIRRGGVYISVGALILIIILLIILL